MSANDNPFALYRDKLIGANYSTALSLQAFVLSMYNGNTWKFRGDSLSNFDEQHLVIFMRLASWYREHTESCPVFMETCRTMIEKRKQLAAENLRELEKLRDTDLANFDGTAADLRHLIDDREKQYEVDKGHYLID